MMPTIGRLKTRLDFLKVAAARAKWVTPGLILQARRRPAPEPAIQRDRPVPKDSDPDIRVGFTVSRKVGNAVRRNRARRRLRAVAQEIMPGCGRAGTDYVLIGRRETLERPYTALRDDLCAALKRLGRDRSAGQAPRTGR